ncbi:hypothetical protein HNQ54_002662 [Anaerocolumna cellulosilytica]|nr:hypothetical protein [Anaerocolumna cellulosilytica]
MLLLVFAMLCYICLMIIKCNKATTLSKFKYVKARQKRENKEKYM